MGGKFPGGSLASSLGRVVLALLDVLRQVPEASVAMFSLLRILPGNDTVVGQSIGWAVVFVVLLTVSPFFTPASLGRDDRPLVYRVLFATISIAYALAIGNYTNRPHAAPGVIAVFAVAVLLFVAYFHYLTTWDLFDPGGRAVALIDSYMPFADIEADVRSDLAREGAAYYASASVWLIAFGVPFSMLCFLTGIGTALIGRAFPVADLLLLATVVVDVASGRSIDAFTLDERVYAGISSARRSLKGTTIVLFCVSGLFFSAILGSVVLTQSYGWFQLIRIALGKPIRLLVVWDVVGLFVVLSAAVVYAFWYWLRVLARVPGFLDEWTNAESDAIVEKWRHGTAADREPVRPPGLTLPPTLAMLGVVPFVVRMSDLDDLAYVAFAVGWPLLVATMAFTAWATTRMDAQSTDREDGVVAASVLVQTWGIVVAGRWASSTVTHPGHVVFAPSMLFVAVAVSLVYLPDLIRVGARASDHYRYVGSAFLAAIGVANVAIGGLLDGVLASFVSLLGVACVVGGAAIAVVTYVERG